jgi:hypothetical protein
VKEAKALCVVVRYRSKERKKGERETISKRVDHRHVLLVLGINMVVEAMMLVLPQRERVK